MRRRRDRSLSPDELRLWTQVARAVKPLKGRALPEEPAAPPPAPPPAPASSPLPRAKAPAAPPAPTLPPLVPLERKTRLALGRGTRRVEGVIDLHGMRQSEAHGALLGFLHQSQARGRVLVLVVTGKGAEGLAGPFEERGVLRRMVPHWLRLPDLRTLVLGFEEAAPHHGGSGALYVRLRRRRGPGEAP
ncbi:Smr/MutS family protein [Salinarimonas soli]|uniref:DNA mismatch repair protein MutS n=1 Tax=Salinarimonas soli TaxID=1638099 RepID=A0A5B2VI53_9HYPH|nr:Smr/MutS family protein [Salinarimonas soli]KAA2237867.1 DNA mismatch repair protein MutS [Salinarimonas soli]